MKSLPVALQTHLDSGTTTLCWCWKITRQDGVVFGFTDHDLSISFGGVDYEPESGLTASELRAGSELNVDAQDAQGVLTSDRITEADILDGRWDAAVVELWRVNWTAVGQRVLMRRGAIGEVRRGRMAFTAEIRSLAHVLDQSLGRSFQFACDAALGDARCKVDTDLPAFTDTGSVAQVIRDRAFTASGITSFSDGWFSSGVLTWTSGANNGRRAEVVIHQKAGAVVTLTLLEGPVNAIDAGDDFTIVAGCDKQAATCWAKFANIENFRGFPHIPGQDTVLRYAKSGNLNDGSPL